MRNRMGKISGKQLFIYSSVAIATVLMFLHHYTSNTIIALAGLVFLLLPIPFISFEECVYLLLFYVPNVRMYKLATGNTFIGFLIVLVFLKVFFLKRSSFGLTTVIAILSMFLVILVNVMGSGNLDMVSPFVRFSMGMMVIVVYLKNIKKNANYKTEYDRCIKHFTYGTVSMVVCGILFCLLTGKSIFGGRFAAVHNGPNFTSMTIGVAVSLLLTHIAFGKKPSTKDFVVMLFLLFGGLITVSRSFLISVSVNLILIMYIFMKGKSLSFNKKLSIVLLIIVLCIIFSGAIGNIIGSFEDRFNDDSMEGGNGRVEIEANYISLWQKTPVTILFGIGKAHNLYLLGLADAVHHNYYIELLTSIGVLGTIAMFGIYVVMFRSVFPNRFKIRFLLGFPVLTYAIMLLTLPALFDDTHLLMITLVLLQYRTFQDEGRSNIKNEALFGGCSGQGEHLDSSGMSEETV